MAKKTPTPHKITVEFAPWPYIVKAIDKNGDVIGVDFAKTASGAESLAAKMGGNDGVPVDDLGRISPTK